MPGRILQVYRDAFAGLPRNLWLLAFTMFVNRAGSMVLGFMTLYLTVKMDLSAFEAGRVVGMYGVGSMIGAWLGGWLSDRFDPNQVQRATLLVSGTGFLLFPMVESYRGLLVAALFLAIVADSFRPAVMVAAVRYSDRAHRTRAFSVIRLAMSLGMGFGLATGGLLASIRYELIFWVDGGTCILAALVHFALLGALPPVRESSREAGAPARLVWHDRPFLVFLALTVGVCVVIFQLLSTWPLYLRDAYFLGERGIGAMFSANAILIALFEMVLVRRLQHRNQLRLAGFGALVVCGGMALMPVAPPFVFAAVISLLVWTLGEMMFLPLTLSVVGNRAHDTRTGSYMGAYAFCFSLALVLAPVLGTAVYENLSPAVLWYGCGALGPFFWLGYTRLARAFDDLPLPVTEPTLQEVD